MTGAQFGSFILGLIVVAIVVAIVVWLLHWLYLRSSKERSFVRTGLGGQKVVLDGGAFVLPIVHDVIPVNMNTLRLEVTRGRDKALITRDRMRVDLMAEFYVRVAARPEAVAAAAQTLGLRTMEPEQLKELVEGKFVDALRTAAAEMTMEELHEKRGAYVRRVRETVAEDLTKNGLKLESVSLTQLDQTGMEFFNPSNAFDAEGLTRLTETIEQRKKQRNDVEQDTLIAIRNKNLEAEKLSLEIDREGEYARLSQQREVEIARARQRAELQTERAQREEAGRERADRRQADDRRGAHPLRADDRAGADRQGAHDPGGGDRAAPWRSSSPSRSGRSPSRKESEAQSVAQAAADEARAAAVSAEEKVFTAREVEMAERRKAIELIGSRQAAEREALRLTSAARAEKDASADRGAAIRAQAEADADADKIKSMAMRVRAEIEAEALRLMNDAHNMLSPEARMSALRMRLVEKAEAIIRESVRPMERIEGIKILHVDGLGGSGGGGQRRRRPSRRQLLRRPGELGPALPRPGAAGRPAAARDRPRGRRHPAPGRRRERRAGGAAAGRRTQGDEPVIRVYTSSVIDASADTVWSRIRDFNGLPQWHPGIADSRIENGEASDKVGCIRHFHTKDGGMIRERLLALSDYDYSCVYEILESPMGVENYVATLKLTPVTDGVRCFAEWSAEFDCAEERERELVETIGQGVFQGGFDALKRHFGRR